MTQPIDAENQVYTLGGRTFMPVRASTFEHDIYVMTHVRAGGLTQIAGLLDPEKPIEEVSWEVLSRLYESGRCFEVLGAVLTEDGQPWTRTAAAANAAFFAQLTDPADKEQLRAAIVELTLSFFVLGATSSRISLSSLTARMTPTASPRASEEPSTSATGEA